MTRPRCPQCPFGVLRPVKSTYVQPWGSHTLTVPNFTMHRCDYCGHTRYDMAALSLVTRLLGPESEEWHQPLRRRHYQTEGPGDRGPRSWSS